jgi:hypothetical protein
MKSAKRVVFTAAALVALAGMSITGAYSMGKRQSNKNEGTGGATGGTMQNYTSIPRGSGTGGGTSGSGSGGYMGGSSSQGTTGSGSGGSMGSGSTGGTSGGTGGSRY